MRFSGVFSSITGSLRMIPSFLIIGAQKAGTTSLFHYLSQHEDIIPPAIKEVHYFSDQYHKGWHWYKKHFPLRRSGKITGEATPYYSFHPQALKRIVQDLPDVRIIFLLRDPVERAVSHYYMQKRKGLEESASLYDAVQRELERYDIEHARMIHDGSYTSRFHKHFCYFNRGLYSQQITRLHELFSTDQVLLLNSKELFSSPETVLQKCCRFLKLRSFVPTDLKAWNQGGYRTDEDFEFLKQMYSEEYLRYGSWFD